MPRYREIEDSEWQIGALVKQELGDAWSNNADGIAAGVSGAPRFQLDAFDSDVVRLAIGAETDAGDVGSYVMAFTSSTAGISFGGDISGGSLRPAGVTYDNTTSLTLSSHRLDAVPLSGTWRCMGFVDSGSNRNQCFFVRKS